MSTDTKPGTCTRIEFDLPEEKAREIAADPDAFLKYIGETLNLNAEQIRGISVRVEIGGIAVHPKGKPTE